MSALAWLCGFAWATTPPAGVEPADVEEAAEPTVEGAALAPPPAEPTFPVLNEGQCQPTDPHFDLELMYYEKKFSEGAKEAEKRLQSTPDDPVLHWMRVRFLYEVGERFSAEASRSTRIAHYKEMVATADQGVKISPKDPHLRFARGVAMGRLGTTRGVLSSLFMAKDVERDWLAVAENPTWKYASLGGNEVLPCDAFHALGIFYRLVPDWWIVQVLAGTRGSLEKSLSFNQKAVQCRPRKIQNWKELAATQFCLATKNDDSEMMSAGLKSVERGLAIRAKTELGRIDHRHLRDLQADPSLGCGYSRDGQQDLDEKKLDKKG